MQRGVTHSRDMGSGIRPQLPISHTIRRGDNPTNILKAILYPYNSSVFSPPVQYSINYMRYSILYYKISFVVDDFAQLYAIVF